ncbi:hypothetical protein DACRYDRAFT_22130 [Dacryopinax primogenitus]|uniref:Uncharacterized protein n=1 Tax=Dacryopinax primogenitus (strain DJM 731) TaxID=1858805 RepID=M5FV83_DACPD|nr:uncharacterized protein DACRYDRAFT_22130 [Dacryopinax primogenitus]EJU01681.1 hypothetical protein DACRYDRAFT_22130 [Dacryopinax primogenitus]
MLTVMGVVIGFVISYGASISRLIWYHVPPRYCAPRDGVTGRIALGLVEAYAVALKHHLRGEMGVYYKDLYRLVWPESETLNPRW